MTASKDQLECALRSLRDELAALGDSFKKVSKEGAEIRRPASMASYQIVEVVHDLDEWMGWGDE